jgi:hypothetical protein
MKPLLLLLTASAVAMVQVIGPASGPRPAMPPRRAHHALAYDEARERVVLTGGSTPTEGGEASEFFNDLWEYDGAARTSLEPSGARLSGMRLAYDRRQQRLFSFGGFDGAEVADLRVLEGGSWRTVSVLAGMPAAEGGFAYDSRRERFVLFGGSPGGGQAHADTWEYDGSAWTRFAGAGPPARLAHAMAFDERRGRVVVFGGSGLGAPGQPRPTLDDTWEYDGQAWTQWQGGDAHPSARTSAGITYDSRRGLVIVFGGIRRGTLLGDTWSWDGAEWKELSTSGPEPRAMGYLAYDRRRDRVVLFGGRKQGHPHGDLSDTWEWDGTDWRPVPGE